MQDGSCKSCLFTGPTKLIFHTSKVCGRLLLTHGSTFRNTLLFCRTRVTPQYFFKVSSLLICWRKQFSWCLQTHLLLNQKTSCWQTDRCAQHRKLWMHKKQSTSPVYTYSLGDFLFQLNLAPKNFGQYYQGVSRRGIFLNLPMMNMKEDTKWRKPVAFLSSSRACF